MNRIDEMIKLLSKTPYTPILNCNTNKTLRINEPITFTKLNAIYARGFSSALKINCGIDHMISKAIIHPTNRIKLSSLTPSNMGERNFLKMVIIKPKEIEVIKKEIHAELK